MNLPVENNPHYGGGSPSVPNGSPTESSSGTFSRVPRRGPHPVLSKENILLCVLFGSLFFSAFWRLPYSPATWFDEGINIGIVKSLVEDGVYTLEVGPGEFVTERHFLITTNYPVLLPVALSVKLFGFNFYAARLPMAIFLILFAWCAYRFVLKLYSKKTALLSLALLLTFVPLYGNGKAVLGEVAGLFFFLAGLLLLPEARYRGRLLFVGVLFGLSIAVKPFFTIVERPEEADFFAVPYEYFFAADACPAYLERVFALAKTAGKMVLLFDYTDYVDRKAKIPAHAVLFRVSAYRHHKQHNEIIMPYFVEDMGVRYGIAPKEKGASCVVGYCGQSQFGSAFRAWRAFLKRVFQALRLRLAGDVEPSAHARGVFWRARALAALRQNGIVTSVVERSFYSLHRASALVDPLALRRAFVENLRGSDLALCARGDANNSQRFYEALSASRVPLFLDTDCVLPLEEIIPYDRVILRVPSREIAALPARVRAWWGAQTPESFLAQERRTRGVYEQYLRLDRFFALVFDRNRSPYTKLLYGQ